MSIATTPRTTAAPPAPEVFDWMYPEDEIIEVPAPQVDPEPEPEPVAQTIEAPFVPDKPTTKVSARASDIMPGDPEWEAMLVALKQKRLSIEQTTKDRQFAVGIKWDSLLPNAAPRQALVESGFDPDLDDSGWTQKLLSYIADGERVPTGHRLHGDDGLDYGGWFYVQHGAFIRNGLIDFKTTWRCRYVVPKKDADDEDEQKYNSQGGLGSIISIHPKFWGGIGHYRRALIIEGTKPEHTAVPIVPSDTIVIGIQGITAWGKNGIPDGIWAMILRGVEEVVILADADMTNNQMVYDNVARIRDHVSTVTGIKMSRVKIATTATTANSKAGLDDYVRAQGLEQRKVTMLSLLEKATTKMGRRPSNRRHLTRSSTAARQFWDHGIMASPMISVDAAGHQKVDEHRPDESTMVCGAAIAIARITTEIEDLAVPPSERVMLLLEGRKAIVGEDMEKDFIDGQIEIPETDLNKPRTYLPPMFKNGEGSLVSIPDESPKAYSKIGNLIREFDNPNVERVTKYRRSGLIEDPERGVGWVGGNGTIFAKGVDYKTTMADMQGTPVDRMQVKEVHMVKEASRDHVRTVFKMLDYFNDKLPVVAGLASVAFALTGAKSYFGMYLWGGAGGGKTMFAQTLMSCMGSKFHYDSRVPAKIASSLSAMRKIVAPIHSSIMLFDDAFDTDDPMEERAFKRIVVALSAVGHEDETVWRFVSGGTDYKDVNQPARTRYIPVMTSNNAPSAYMPLSREQRIVSVHFTNDTMRKSTGPVFKKWAKDGTLNYATSKLIQWIIKTYGDEGLLRMQEKIEDLREVAKARIDALPGMKDAGDRDTNVPAMIPVGFGLWVDMALEYGYITLAEADKYTALAWEVAETLAVENLESRQATRPDLMQEIMSLAMNENKAYFSIRKASDRPGDGEAFDAEARGECIGIIHEPDGRFYLHRPSLLIAMKNRPGWSESAIKSEVERLARAFAVKVQTDTKSDERVKHTIGKRFGRYTKGTDCYILPLDFWETEPQRKARVDAEHKARDEARKKMTPEERKADLKRESDTFDF